MPTPDRRVGWKECAAVFEGLGFVLQRDRDDHGSYHKLGVTFPICVPKVASVDLHVIKSNCRTAGITLDEFFRLLDKIHADGAD